MSDQKSSNLPQETIRNIQPNQYRINVSGINIEWKSEQGICTFENMPVAMMWVDTTLAGLFSGIQAMVGTRRYLLALQREGRKSVEADWAIISRFKDFKDGFAAIATIAAVAGWGEWRLESIDVAKKECRFRIMDSWEGRYQKALGVKWGSGMLAGKMAGYCTRLFNTNCWADQTGFIAGGDPYDEFIVKPSNRIIENEIDNLLATDEATRADMAVALKKLENEIVERKQAEEEKGKVQDQLQQAMKMEAVGRLAGGVAHDFNNLLTAIMGNVSLALMKLSPSDQARSPLSEANKAAERAAALTQQLLAFSRKQIIEPKIIDLNELIEGMHTMLSRLIGEHIHLKSVPGESLGLVKVDPGQFEQIQVNLAVNARDAMPEGGVLTFETANVDLDEGYCARHPDVCPGRYVMLAVSDTGHGMSEEVRKRIFEPFFTTKPKGAGTGLGLATIYGVVRQANGCIDVYSEVGTGTTFKIYLPRVEGEPVTPRESDLPMDLLAGTETVLVVEDEEIVRNLCVRILERLGYLVMHASNGDEAIALAKEHKPRIDLLMTDVVMPGIHGRELANLLASIHPETRVLFTSGYTDNAIIHHGVLDEDVSFIGKPYSPWALARKVREVLGKV